MLKNPFSSIIYDIWNGDAQRNKARLIRILNDDFGHQRAFLTYNKREIRTHEFADENEV